MKVVLLEDVRGKGKKNDVVNVSDGYARNYLFPKKLASEANASKLSEIKNKKESEKFRHDESVKQANELVEKLQGVTVKIKMSGSEGKLYGSVSTSDVSDALNEQCGIEIDKRKIVMDGNIKSFGNYELDVKVYPGITGKINLIVAD